MRTHLENADRTWSMVRNEIRKAENQSGRASRIKAVTPVAIPRQPSHPIGSR
jgi:hypothetical protein